MTDNGYIKLHRQVLDSWVFTDEKAFKIWMWLLMKANYKDRYMKVHSGRGSDTVLIKRGQCVYGRIKAEEELNISGSVIYRLLGKMEQQEMIKVESNAQYSLITICNYDTYQEDNNENETRSEHDRNTLETRSEHIRNTLETRSDTIEEGKESKERKELNTARDQKAPTAPSNVEERLSKIMAAYPLQHGTRGAMIDLQTAYVDVMKSRDKIREWFERNEPDGEIQRFVDDPPRFLYRRVKRFAELWEGQDMTYCPTPSKFFRTGRYWDPDSTYGPREKNDDIVAHHTPVQVIIPI